MTAKYSYQKSVQKSEKYFPAIWNKQSSISIFLNWWVNIWTYPALPQNHSFYLGQECALLKKKGEREWCLNFFEKLGVESNYTVFLPYRHERSKCFFLPNSTGCVKRNQYHGITDLLPLQAHISCSKDNSWFISPASNFIVSNVSLQLTTIK